MKSKRIVIFALAALIVGACGREEPPEIQMDTLEVAPPANATEVSRLAALCRERARVARLSASVEAVFRADDALSYGKVNQWKAARDKERQLARELLGVYSMSREARLSVGACVWYGEDEQEYSLSLVNGLLLADEIDDLLADSGAKLEDVGVTTEEFRQTVLNDVRLTLVEAEDEPYLFDWIATRACRRGFKPLELGLEPADFGPRCRYTGGTG